MKAITGDTAERLPLAMMATEKNTVILRKSGLLFTRTPQFRKWEFIGRQLISVVDSSTWWIADWLVYGETTFHERYIEAIQKTSLSYQTLRNYAWVARRFELSRRRDELSFGHHAEVAALDQPEQDFWLRKAEKYGWSRNRLRSEVRTSLRERTSTAVTEGVAQRESRFGATASQPAIAREGTVAHLRLPLSGDQVLRFREIAESSDLSLEQWAVKALEAAAGKP